MIGWHAAGATGNPATAHHLAASLELFHAFCLIHDDVMDHSTTRRGAVVVRHVTLQGRHVGDGDRRPGRSRRRCDRGRCDHHGVGLLERAAGCGLIALGGPPRGELYEVGNRRRSRRAPIGTRLSARTAPIDLTIPLLASEGVWSYRGAP
ncbi:polyprenyl synthetase family protein [Streptomyces albireticuli]|nr:polyprenyl synthetase family protein [Streptomyces albireticuli]MCD9146051.1 polyprenyl synthetase family protein [Streptomyces albireticuli]MCD9166180.1 polyprenyl synthetase family protein [Streptomyces albireticuli]MCD9196503.1 polyprenyl synthetase family protein [Streptomyces albireticuli]